MLTRCRRWLRSNRIHVYPIPPLVAAWVLGHTYPGPALREALTAALVPVALLVFFGFTYAADLLPKRSTRGYRTDTHTLGTVGVAFVVGVITLAVLLTYLAIESPPPGLGAFSAGLVGYSLGAFLALLWDLLAPPPAQAAALPRLAPPRSSGRRGSVGLRSPPVAAEPADPFSSDLLNRRTQVENLSAILTDTPGPASALVDAPWGCGKTAFLRMCAAYLRSCSVTVVEWNAWDQQHTGQPLLDLLSSVADQLPAPSSDRVSPLAAHLADLLADSRPPRVDTWHEHHRLHQAITTTLETVAAERGQLVIAVDELDRCQPDYALAALAELHHRFSVNRVAVLMAADRRQLCEMVRSVHGKDYGADAYLRRFADLHINLVPPTRTRLGDFLNHLIDDADLGSAPSGCDASALQALRTVVELERCCLRDLEQAVHTYALALSEPTPDEHPTPAWQAALAALTVLRIADRDAYLRFVSRDADAFAAVAALYSALGPEPDSIYSGEGWSPAQRVDFLTAALLSIGALDPAWLGGTGGHEAFLEQYRTVHRHRPSPRRAEPDPTKSARDVLRQLALLRRHYRPPQNPRRPLFVEPLAELLDLSPDVAELSD